MKAVIDTSSLLSLARYYLPYDKNNILHDFLIEKLKNGELIIIDKVLQESRFVSQKAIPKSLPFLTDNKFCNEYRIGEDTAFLIPPAPKRFYRMVENNFVVKSQVELLENQEYEALKTNFLNSADCKMIIKCDHLIASKEECLLITEESMQPNDRKLFHKIPKICQILDIDCCNIQEYLERTDEIKIEIS